MIIERNEILKNQRMKILPAIDLRGGKCVRLRQGDYHQETIFGDNPVEMAKQWVSLGADYLHLVDLDGAKTGSPQNLEIVRQIVKAISCPCQMGGGIRSEKDIQEVLSIGVERVILGTKAFTDREWLKSMIYRYPNKIVLGLDARNGKVAANGWLEVLEISMIEAAKQVADWPLAAIVYTDISKDGMMQGPDFAGLELLLELVDIPIIASGGVSNLEHIRQLTQLGRKSHPKAHLTRVENESLSESNRPEVTLQAQDMKSVNDTNSKFSSPTKPYSNREIEKTARDTNPEFSGTENALQKKTPGSNTQLSNTDFGSTLLGGAQAKNAHKQIFGCIIGRALYEGQIHLPSALALITKETQDSMVTVPIGKMASTKEGLLT